MNKKYLFFTLILSNFCNHYSFTMDNQALSEIRAIDIIKNKEIANDYRTLYLATSFGDFDTVKLLIEGKGLNPNKIMRGPSLFPELCLNTAIRRNQVNIAKYLIAKGANINLLPNPGISFTEWVLKQRFKPDIFELFVEELVKKNKLADIDPNTRETLLHKLTDNTYYNLEYQKYTIPMILNELLNQLGPKGTLEYIRAKNIYGCSVLQYNPDEIGELLYSFYEKVEKIKETKKT